MLKHLSVKGLNLIRNKLGQLEYQFNEVADENTAKTLIESLENGIKLMFFDAKHPTISDPGAYITITRTDGFLLSMRANHGWSSKWIPISKSEAITYLNSCIQSKSSDQETRKLWVGAIRPPASEQINFSPSASFRLFLKERLA